MANRDFPVRHASPRGTQLWRSLATEEMPWIHTTRFGWECTITHETLSGAYATQTTIVTIPSSGFVTGRLTITIPRPGTTSVTVTADAAVGDTEEDLATAGANAVEALVATTLAGVVTGATADGGDITISVVGGIGIIAITATYTPAQQTTVTWGGTLVNGLYSVRFVSASPVADVTVANNRVAGTPANVNAMAAALETAASALIGTTLAGVLVSADDAGAVNTLIFEPGVTCTVTASVTPNTTHTFGGTATDGDYVTRFTHASLPGGSLTITTPRAAGSPATNTDLADAFEADVEARLLLTSGLLVNADNTAGANIISFFDGVSSMDVTAVSAPAPGTLVVSDPTAVVADATPAGPTVTVAHSVTLSLNSIAFDGGFPANAIRSWCFISVIDEFGASRTITVGDADEPAGVLGSTPVTLNTIARACSSASDAEYQPRPELAWVPTATIALGSSTTLTAGEVLVEVLFTPNLANVAAA
jgi:hypothetical protein